MLIRKYSSGDLVHAAGIDFFHTGYVLFSISLSGSVFYDRDPFALSPDNQRVSHCRGDTKNRGIFLGLSSVIFSNYHQKLIDFTVY